MDMLGGLLVAVVAIVMAQATIAVAARTEPPATVVRAAVARTGMRLSH